MLRLASLCLPLLALALPAGAANLSLSSAGQTDYTIVVDPDATATEQYAAEELAVFLKQVTGAEFPLRRSVTASSGPMLVVGPGRVQEKLAPGLKLDQLKPDGIVIETAGKNLLFAGDRPRGTMYAVYTFLEDTVGCRWWSSKASYIPSKPTLTVPEQHVRYIPPLEYREPFWWDAFDADFAARNKYNGMRANLDDKRGGKISYVGFVHTFDPLVPAAKYGKQHPEWYSERGGKRIVSDTPHVQLCLTNPEVKAVVLQAALDWIKKNPSAKIISISQNDWDGHCQCAKCMEIETAEESPMGPLLIFVNDLAREIGKLYPDIAVDTLAYQYTRKPPKTVRPLPNVIIRLCSIECDFGSPLTSESNKKFAEDIAGWSKICNRLYIWDYTTNFGHYIQPHPNLRVLGPNVRFFVKNGVKGIFEQGNYQSPGGEMAELRAWVLAKLLWNPQLDDRKLVEEFVNGYYGPAAPYISQYLKLLHDEVETKKFYLGIGVPPTSPYLSLGILAQCEQLFNKAEQAAANDSAVLQRVQVARLPLRYVWSTRWHELQAQARRQGLAWPGRADYLGNAQTFMQVAKEYNVTMLSEGRKIDTFAQRTIGLGRITSPPPPGCENLDPSSYFDLQDANANIASEGKWGSLQHDDLASDKVAVRMPGDHFEWATQVPLGIVGLDTEATYGVYVSIRCEKLGDEGLGFSSGIYDALNKKWLGEIRRQCKEITSDKYETYKLGSVKLHGGVYLWAAPPKNPDNMKAIWVDRFWLVKEK